MANKSYVLVQDFNAPYVVATGMAHKPSRIMIKKYRKGDIIEGELKTTGGKPTIVLVRGVIPIPVTMLRVVVTKEILSSANGAPTAKPQLNTATTINTVSAKKTNTRYLDSGIIGAILGIGAVYLAEKQGWIATAETKNKLYGAAVGAVLGMYFVYRKK
jgi:hypothetical protein